MLTEFFSATILPVKSPDGEGLRKLRWGPWLSLLLPFHALPSLAPQHLGTQATETTVQTKYRVSDRVPLQRGNIVVPEAAIAFNEKTVFWFYTE